MLCVEDWAEIRRSGEDADQSDRPGFGCSKNTVKAALVADRPPKYSRASMGSIVDEVEPRIRELLAAYPTVPPTVITERIGWTRSIRTDTFLGERY